MLGIVQRASQPRGGFGAAWWRLLEPGKNRAFGVVEDRIAQADAMGRQQRTQCFTSAPYVIESVAIGELADAAAGAETEGVGEEQLAVRRVGFEHQLVHVRILLRIPGQ